MGKAKTKADPVDRIKEMLRERSRTYNEEGMTRRNYQYDLGALAKSSMCDEVLAWIHKNL